MCIDASWPDGTKRIRASYVSRVETACTRGSIRKRPDEPRRLFDLGLALCEHAFYDLADSSRMAIADSAEAVLARVEALDPKHPFALYWLATANELQGETQAEIKAYERALTIETDLETGVS